MQKENQVILALLLLLIAIIGATLILTSKTVVKVNTKPIVQAVQDSLKDTTTASTNGYKSGLQDGATQAQSLFQSQIEQFQQDLNTNGEAQIGNITVVNKAQCK